MGSFSQHSAFGLSLALFFQAVPIFPQGMTQWIAWLVFILGCVLPDVDHPKSTPHRVFLWPRLYKGWSHRGHVHSFAFAAISSVIVAFFWVAVFGLFTEINAIVFGFTIFCYHACGVTSHLFLDDLLSKVGGKKARKALKMW